MSEQIQKLARSMAKRNLTLRQALFLFDAMVIGDALFLERGNVSRAAERLDVERGNLNKLIGKIKQQRVGK